MIDDGLPHNDTGSARAIDPAAPDTATKGIEISWMLFCERGLGLTISGLLCEVGFDGGPPIMPDKAGRAEPNPVTDFLKAPAHIHIVTGLPENRIKAADLFQCPFEKGHVAPRN